MICVNELGDLKCHKRAILEPLVILLSPFAPHMAEELWHLCGYTNSVVDASWPKANDEFLKDDSVVYPVSFNGKMRFKLEMPAALAHEGAVKWTEGKTVRKVIVVPGKIINIVVS
jgi:leucyl-tRNA synthetase